MARLSIAIRRTGAPTKPAAGVIATSPAMAPVQKPTMLHFLSSRKSISSHESPLRSISLLRIMTGMENGGEDVPDTAGEVGVEDGKRCLQARGKATAAVEAEPADPQEHGAEDDLRDIAGLEDDPLGTVTPSLADKVRVGKTARSGCNLDRHTASVAATESASTNALQTRDKTSTYSRTPHLYAQPLTDQTQ